MSLLNAAHHVADLFFPSQCDCGSRAPADSRLCSACLEKLVHIETSHACGRCALPLSFGAACPRCLGRGFRPFRKIHRLGTFKDPLKRLIHRMKYHGDWTLAEFMADRFAQTDHGKAALVDIDCLVPVPLHPWREFTRGFNQSAVIAARLAKHSKSTRVADALARTRNTPHQTDMTSKAKRLENVRAAFALLDGKQIAGKRVALVDDVMTLGATLRAAARILSTAKPKSIEAIVIAVADPRKRDFQVV